MMRFTITTCLGALLVWTAAAQDQPKIETFLGYTYVRFYPANVSPAFSANGGRAEFVYNFNHWLGGVIDAGAVTNNNFAGFNINNTQTFFMGGPRFTFHRRSRFKPYAQAVFGGVYYTASTPVQGFGQPLIPPFLNPGVPVTASLVTSQTKFALAAGVGLDITLNHWLAFRPGAIDYYYTRIGDLRSIGDNSQNNLRYSAGLNFMFGGEKPAPPAAPQTKKCPDGTIVSINEACPKQNVSMSLVANPAELCPGDTAQVTPTAGGMDLSGFHNTWSVNGQPVSQGATFAFTGRDPGTYTIGLTAANDKFNPASAKTTIVVHEYVPPSGTVEANPSQIAAGDKSSITSRFTGQCGGPIQAARYTASEGSIVGDQFDSSTIQWDTSNNAEQRKTVTITAKAADNKSEGTATTQIEVMRKATAAPIRLPDVLFSKNSSRVNNCGKRVLLEQLRSYYERDSSGTVVLVGHQSADETAADLANQRVLNSAAVITAGTGVCLSIPKSQVQVSAPGTDQQGVSFDPGFCASSVTAGPSSEMRRVAVWFVPNGAAIPASVTNAQPASATTVGSLGCPK